MRITVEYRVAGGDQHELPAVRAEDRPGAACCYHDGHPALVGFGWLGDMPALWLHVGTVDGRQLVGAGTEVILADLRDEPVVNKPGPIVHWRWRLVASGVRQPSGVTIGDDPTHRPVEG
jgi:hypothetical protein